MLQRVPYFIGDVLELPLTTVQDYSLFHIIGDYSIGLWQKQIDLILKQHGLISFLAHPDYLLPGNALGVYKDLLTYLRALCQEKAVWTALPSEVNRWWRQRRAMSVVFEGGRWHVRGQGSERARVAFASVQNNLIVYTLEKAGRSPRDISIVRRIPLASEKTWDINQEFGIAAGFTSG